MSISLYTPPILAYYTFLTKKLKFKIEKNSYT